MNIIKKATLLLLLAIVINAVLFAYIWAHHTFVPGLRPLMSTVFGILSLLILVPVVFLSFSWVARQSPRLTPAMAFIFGLFVLLGIVIRGTTIVSRLSSALPPSG